MTATDLAVRDPQASAISAKIAYARALAESGLLPASYRKNPANVLWAMEYGEMLGLSPVATMTGVHVIDGKPTASAGLISGLVRQAHHKLRVWGDGDSATCEIIRSDEPKHVFSVTWTLKKTGPNPSAEEAKLLGKDVWQKYPASMLKSRAITQCARDACDEVLFGLHYTPEELGAEVDEDGVVVDEAGYDEQEHPASRAGGTPPDDPWYVRPAPEPAAGGTRSWADIALEQAKAGTFKTEAGAWALWREAAEPGKCTPKQKDEIQNRVAAWIKARRKDASERLLRHLSEDDDWREKVRGLADDDEAREALGELGRLKAAGTMNETRAGRVAAAVIALHPKAALKAGDDGG